MARAEAVLEAEREHLRQAEAALVTQKAEFESSLEKERSAARARWDAEFDRSQATRLTRLSDAEAAVDAAAANAKLRREEVERRETAVAERAQRLAVSEEALVGKEREMARESTRREQAAAAAAAAGEERIRQCTKTASEREGRAAARCVKVDPSLCVLFSVAHLKKIFACAHLSLSPSPSLPPVIWCCLNLLFLLWVPVLFRFYLQQRA